MTSAADPVDAALRAALAAALSDYFGRPQQVIGLERRPYVYRSSFALEDLEIRLDDGRVLQVLWKDTGWQSLTSAAQRAKPQFLHDPLREIETYRHILGTAGAGAARCYGT